MSRPATSIVPEVTSIIRRMACAVDVFPQPDSPINASISPRRNENETPSTADIRWCGSRRSAAVRSRLTG